MLRLAACAVPSAPDGAHASAGLRDPSTPPARLRVLVLSGGGYHDFGSKLERLVEGLDVPHGVDRSFLPLGEVDPDGVPVALRLRRLETPDFAQHVDVVLAYTQGELGLSVTTKERLLAFVHAGGGFVGLHCAADSHPGWAAYTRMLGGRFESHPPYGRIAVRVDDGQHPVSAGLPAEFELEDEFYHLTDLHLDDAVVLMSGLSPAGGAARPVNWVKSWGRGRVVYTILGHGAATHADARYRELVGQALAWAAGDG